MRRGTRLSRERERERERRAFAGASTRPTPKSTSLILAGASKAPGSRLLLGDPSTIMTFAGLMSRCTMPDWCMKLQTEQSW